MELFNTVKRLPITCLQWAFRLCYATIGVAGRAVRGSGRIAQRAIGDVIAGIAAEAERVLIVGARNSGKSALLYRIKLGGFIQTVATNSFIEEHCTLCALCLTPSDACVHSQLNQIDVIQVRLCEFGVNDDSDVVEGHMRYSSRLIFVVDGSDPASTGTALHDVANIVTQHNFFHQSPKYVVFNTKTDVAGTSTPCKPPNIKLPEHLKNRAIWVDGSALTGQGVVAAMAFLLLEDPWRHIPPNEKHIEDLIQFD